MREYENVLCEYCDGHLSLLGQGWTCVNPDCVFFDRPLKLYKGGRV
jgi:hypothetical protein